MNATFRTSIVLLAAVGLAGCGGPDLATVDIDTVPARGKVVMADGKPLTEGIITLEPLPDGGSTNAAVGEIQGDGSFEVKSTSDLAGAMPGKYRVKIETTRTRLNIKVGKEPLVEVKDGQDLNIQLH